MCTLELGWSSSQRLRAWAAALWEPESRAERVTTYRSSAPQSNASRYWMGEGQEDWGAVALSFIRQSRAPWSKEASSTTICSPTRMVSGTLTKQSSRSWAGVKSQQLSTMILKLIAGTLLYNNEN